MISSDDPIPAKSYLSDRVGLVLLALRKDEDPQPNALAGFYMLLESMKNGSFGDPDHEIHAPVTEPEEAVSVVRRQLAETFPGLSHDVAFEALQTVVSGARADSGTPAQRGLLLVFLEGLHRRLTD